nr:hypothetical protein [Tanacetum cinerariifolium]
MENTILELVKICQEKELLCMHDNVDDLIESALNSKLLSINSQRLDKEEQEVKNVVEQPAERRNHEIIESGVEELVPILSEDEVTLEAKKECNMPVCENSPVCDVHSEIFSDSKNDDDISSDDNDFEDIEYVEALIPDPEIVSVEEENYVNVEEEEVDLEVVFQIQDIVLHENLLSINRLIANIESLNDNPPPDPVLNSFVSIPISEAFDNSFSDNFSPDSKLFTIIRKSREVKRLINVLKNDIFDNPTSNPLLEEADLFISDNSIPPGIKNFADDSEGDIRFLKELLIDDSTPFPNNESSESDFDNPSIP